MDTVKKKVSTLKKWTVRILTTIGLIATGILGYLLFTGRVIKKSLSFKIRNPKRRKDKDEADRIDDALDNLND